MRARISFAKIGLALTMDDNELLTRLLRSTSLGLSPEERRANPRSTSAKLRWAIRA